MQAPVAIQEDHQRAVAAPHPSRVRIRRKPPLFYRGRAVLGHTVRQAVVDRERLDSVPGYRPYPAGMSDITTGQLASRAGVNVESLRYYERTGLLDAPPRTASGYRRYPMDAVRRLRFIKRAQGLGFTLGEIKELLELQTHPESTCADIRRRAEGKIDDVNRRLRELKALRAALVALTRACAGSGPTTDCSILHMLEGKETT